MALGENQIRVRAPTSMTGKYPSDPIDYLLKRKFGDVLEIDLSDEDPGLAALRADLEAYRAELQSLADHDLEMRVYGELENEAREQEDIEERARPFNQPNASADFEYWGRMPLWTLDEAVALTLGKDPRVVMWVAIENFVGVSRFASRFDDLRRLVLRAKEAKQLTELVSPDDYIAWANTNRVAVPPRLKECVEAYRGQATDWKGRYEATQQQLAAVTDELERLRTADKPLGGKERNTFLKWILGLAVIAYGYDHHATRSSVPKAIADELTALGTPLDEDTVRARLREAAEEYGHLLPPPDATKRRYPNSVAPNRIRPQASDFAQ
jgi:hypothetical protein